jgi:hypothetical protein
VSRLPEAVVLVAGLFAPLCGGQELLDDVNFKSGQLAGLHLVGLSVFSGYSTSAYPQAGLTLNNSVGVDNLGGDESYGASFSVGWQGHAEKTNATVLYTGTYEGMAHYSNLNAYNQSLSLSLVRTLTPKWTFSLTASGQDNTLAQYLYQPSTLSVITQVPTTLSDLAAALAAGQYSNAQVASLLTGAPALQTPERSLLLGDRVLSYSAQASMGYALSSRLNLHFASFTAAGQTTAGPQDGTQVQNYVMPRSIGANAGMGFSYSLSPRTQIGVDVQASRLVNRYQDAYTGTGSASLSRKMGERWFLRAYGGGTYTDVTQQTFGTPKTRQIVGGGSLGYRTFSHTLVASYDRAANDTYGFTVGTVTTMSAAWNWRRAGSRWGVFSSFGDQQTRNTGFASLSGWQGSGGVTASLNQHTTLTAQYVYLNSSGTYLGTQNNLKVQSIRISLGWAPQAVQR